MDPIKAVICCLAGGGDTQLFLLPQLAYDWASQLSRGEHEYPADVLEALQPFKDPDATSFDEAVADGVNITSGSAENDAMLSLSCLVRNYEGIQAMLLDARFNGWTLSDEEYHGCIY